MTDDVSPGSPLGKWIPVIAVIAVVAIIGIYYVTVYLPGQVPVKAPENSLDVTANPMHAIKWTNNCNYPVWVDIVGGKQFPIPDFAPNHVGACGCYKQGNLDSNPLLCNPYTKCDNTFCTPENECDQGTPLVDNGGFYLAPSGGTHASSVDQYWQGAFWGRTGCRDNPDNPGDFRCDIGTCVKSGSADKGQLTCGGISPTGPLTKGEFNFDEGGHDTYDVSLVDGYNVPMSIRLVPGTYKNDGTVGKDFDCTESAANRDLFPLFGTTRLGTKLLFNVTNKTVGMESACFYADSIHDPKANQYCCRGAYHESTACKPETWPEEIRTAPFFKQYNPKAYSFAYNDASSTFQCKSKDDKTLSSYQVTFCAADSAAGLADNGPGVVTTTLITQAPVLTQTAVPKGPYNPGKSGTDY